VFFVNEHTTQITEQNAVAMAETFIGTILPYPSGYSGRGIVICGGGQTYYTNAWVCIHMLRHLGCTLPVELWYLGEGEVDDKMEEWIRPLDVRCINALEMREKYPCRILNGWELKPFSVIHSSFKEVLFLDADNVPAADPTYLFDSAPYLKTGTIFWPDFVEYVFKTQVWRIFGIKRRYERQVESGQLMVDKSKCWKPLNLCMWYNENSDFFYQYTYGDKDTFQLAWRKMNVEYAMPLVFPYRSLGRTIYQYDFDGRKIFQHRNRDKWDLHRKHFLVPLFEHEEKCVEFLDDLRSRWDGQIGPRTKLELI
jgi:Mannosyltransferase putative